MDQSALDALLDKAKEGDLTTVDAAAVAAVLRDPVPGLPLYTAAYTLLRAFRSEYEDLLAGFLTYQADPMVAGLVLTTFFSQWHVGDRYQDALAAALRGYSWDEEEEMLFSGLLAARSMDPPTNDPTIRDLLTAIATEHEDSQIRDLASEALGAA